MVNIERLRGDLEELSLIGRLPTGGVSRPTFSKEDGEARKWLITKFEQAGLETSIDPAGNIIGRMDGSGPAVICGSHLDSIPNGGFFDGVLGILAPLECVRSIKEQGLTTSSPIEIIAFSDEEERFLGFLGSYAFMGDLKAMDLSSITDRSGVTLQDAMAEFGLNIATASRAERDLNDIKAFVEMHIEQGPLLESAGCSVGIVDAIKGNYRFSVTVKGKTDHAGFPMAGRQDALVGAVRLINLQLDAAARYRAEGTLLTVGQIETSPGLENVVPGKARFSIDYRSPDLTVLKELEKILLDQMKTLSEDLNLEMSHETLLVIDPLPLSSDIRTLLIKSAEELKLPYRILQSGAGHDAQVLGARVPTAMLFVPSIKGRSHCPEENTRWEDIEAGTNVLFKTVVEISNTDGAIKK